MDNTTAPTPAPIPATTQSRSQLCHKSMSLAFERAKRIFTTVIPQFLDDHIVAALTFVQTIKSIIENAAVDGVIEGLTKNMAAPILASIENVIDKVIEGLQIELACKGCGTFEEKIRCIADAIAQKEPDLQAALIHRMAVMLSRLTSGDETTTETELNALVAFIENQIVHDTNPPQPAAAPVQA